MTNTNCWATFTGQNGYDYQREVAKQKLTIGHKYKVSGSKMGRYHTNLQLEGVDGSFNSVMFLIEGELPFKFEDNYYRSSNDN
jgi:hypothetical protein